MKKYNEITAKPKFSQHLRDFISHLMSPTHDTKAELKRSLEEDCPECDLSDLNALLEITVLDTRKTPLSKRKGKEVPKVSTGKALPQVSGRGGNEQQNMLTHPHVSQNDPVLHKEHVDRYKKLMKNAQEISRMHPSVYKHMKKGHDDYMAGVGKREDPRVTQKKELTTARKARQEDIETHSGYKKQKLLGKNTKIKKNDKVNDNTVGLNLSPAGVHGVKGHSSCPKSVRECRHSCLFHTTGQNAMLSNINSKISQHHNMMRQPHHFTRDLHAHLLDHVDATAAKNQPGHPEYEKGKKHMASYRGNMVSDYPHDMHAAMHEHIHEYAKRKHKMDYEVRDYTKNKAALYKSRPAWHHLALSHTGQDIKPLNKHVNMHHEESNDHHVGQALNDGHTVASVISGDATHFVDHKHKDEHGHPRTYPIVDGDDDDRIEDRHQQAGHEKVGHIGHKDGKPTGVVSALRIKGGSNEAKEAAGNFVSHTVDYHHPKHGKMRVIEINKKHEHDDA